MKIVIGRSTNFFELIYNVMLPDFDGGTREDYLQALMLLMQTNPESLLLIAVVDETQNPPEPIAYGIAVDVLGRDYVLISQTWVSPKASAEGITKLLFLRLINWMHDKGKTEIRIETSRDPLGMSRRWGFKPHSTTMALTVDVDFEARLMDDVGKNLIKGDDNGQQRTEISQHAEQGSTAPSEIPGGLRDATDRPAGSSLPGSASAEPSGGLSADIEQSLRDAGIHPADVERIAAADQ